VISDGRPIVNNLNRACPGARSVSGANLFAGSHSFCRASCRVLVHTTGVLLATNALATEPSEVEPFHEPQAEHCDQMQLLAIADPEERFDEAFDCGDDLFDTSYNMLDGVGANVGDNLRFSRVPRADKMGPTEWANHTPRRATGPNAEACTVCHIGPFEDGAGAAGLNVVRDPLHTANPAQFIQRNPPHLFGAGGLQRLAEEMTTDLREAVERGRNEACARGNPVLVSLETKDVSFGTASIDCSGIDDLSGREGIDENLIVKPFQWKGNFKTIREFNRDASNNELGMQAVEIVGHFTDGDGDRVTDEFSVGDMTAMAVYVAAQPRPSSKLELNSLRLLDLTGGEIAGIRRGEQVFRETGCADCHRPSLIIDQPVFSEPSQTPEFIELLFPTGQDPVAEGVDFTNPISFDLTADQPDNVLNVRGREIHFGAFEKTRSGRAIVRLYGDLKRHDMGVDLAENIDETGSGNSVWLTKELWGVGSTAPYLHDGRATTLTEAILEHGGEAESSRNQAASLSQDDFASMIAFLDNLILFKVEQQEVVVFGDRKRRHSRHVDSRRFRR
jgi:Di-haem oxidoreductase, putative peroxidase